MIKGKGDQPECHVGQNTKDHELNLACRADGGKRCEPHHTIQNEDDDEEGVPVVSSHRRMACRRLMLGRWGSSHAFKRIASSFFLLAKSAIYKEREIEMKK